MEKRLVKIEDVSYNELLQDLKDIVTNAIKENTIKSRPLTELKNNELYYSRSEVLRILKIANSTLYHLTKSGKLPYIRINRKMLFKKIDIDNFLNNRLIQNGQF